MQRVPATEAQGRIHTSTATVAVLPEAEEVDLELKPEDLRIEVCRSGGPGGQGVNTTDSAVQFMHIPTGTIVRCQDGRSQQKNKEKALSIMRARLLEEKQREEEAKYSAHRKSQIGSGGREEKIRTYNFPQNRITDHRIGLTLYNLDRVMEGDLGEMIQRCRRRICRSAERIALTNAVIPSEAKSHANSGVTGLSSGIPRHAPSRKMTVLEVLQSTTAYFKKREIESPRLNAEHLLAHALGRKRIELYLEFERALHEDGTGAAARTGPAPRAGRTTSTFARHSGILRARFSLRQTRLVPRPETEELVELVLQANCESPIHRPSSMSGRAAA